MTEGDYLINAEPALRCLFLSDDPHLMEFGKLVEKVKILHRNISSLQEIDILDLISVAAKMGDDNYFVSRLCDDPSDPQNHWSISFNETEVQLQRGIIDSLCELEGVIYSKNGMWGMMYSMNRFILLAGTAEYIDAFTEACPEIDSQISEFLQYIKDDMDSDQTISFPWLQPLLIQAFGEEESEKKLNSFNL
jgi:hypothetical protein